MSLNRDYILDLLREKRININDEIDEISDYEEYLRSWGIHDKYDYEDNFDPNRMLYDNEWEDIKNWMNGATIEKINLGTIKDLKAHTYYVIQEDEADVEWHLLEAEIGFIDFENEVISFELKDGVICFDLYKSFNKKWSYYKKKLATIVYEHNYWLKEGKDE